MLENFLKQKWTIPTKRVLPHSDTLARYVDIAHLLLVCDKSHFLLVQSYHRQEFQPLYKRCTQCLVVAL